LSYSLQKPQNFPQPTAPPTSKRYHIFSGLRIEIEFVSLAVSSTQLLLWISKDVAIADRVSEVEISGRSSKEQL
jgi:hypothetical protein